MRWWAMLLLFPALTVSAGRMYQWVDPDTGTPYLSGSPPAWYRSPDGGPRVQVYEEGRLVDDTQWRADRARQRALREQALAAERARQEKAERRLAEERREGRRQAEAAAGDDEAVAVERPEVIKALADDLLERFYKAKLKAAAEEGAELEAGGEGPGG